LTDYFLPANSDGSDFRAAVGVNYHNNIGNAVQPTDPLDTADVTDGGARTFNDGTIRACSTARGAVLLAGCFSVNKLSACSFFKVTGAPVAELTDTFCSQEGWGFGTLYAFTEVTVVSEYTLAEIRTLAGLPADWGA
jgi:hypothetical protein